MAETDEQQMNNAGYVFSTFLKHISQTGTDIKSEKFKSNQNVSPIISYHFYLALQNVPRAISPLPTTFSLILSSTTAPLPFCITLQDDFKISQSTKKGGKFRTVCILMLSVNKYELVWSTEIGT